MLELFELEDQERIHTKRAFTGFEHRRAADPTGDAAPGGVDVRPVRRAGGNGAG